MKDLKTVANSRRGTFVVLLLALVAGLIPVAAAQANVRLKNGIYYQPGTAKNPSFGYVETSKGKVVSAGFYVRFSDKSGKSCVPSGYTDSDGYVSLVFATNKTKPNGSGKFTVRNKKASVNPGLQATVTGQFKTSRKASLKLTAKAGGCTVRRSFTKAVYTAGG